MQRHSDLALDLRDCLGALDRPRRVPVSQGAAEALHLSDPGGYSGPWRVDMVPYLREPMDMLASRQHEAVCFVGPARTGKTAALILGWLAHAMTNDIGRMMIMHMTEGQAETLSKLDVDPALEASPKLKALKSRFAHDNNIKLKIFRHGMAVKFAYPSPSQTAGFTFRYGAMTDFDRFPKPRGAGNWFDNVHKRTETAMSRRMTLVESSPEREITDPSWKPSTPHEAPPAGGILSIYNRGDMRRFYWPCPHCGEFFEAAPGVDLFTAMPPIDELIESIRSIDIGRFAAKHAKIYCPHHGCEIDSTHKHAMNTAGVWLRDGQSISADREITGEGRVSTIASFWLGGVAAAYQSWEGILRGWLHGIQQFVMSGSEEALRKSVYTDQAMPYLPRALGNEAKRGDISELAEDFPRFIAPAATRFVTVAVDVQGGQDSRFVIQAFANAEHYEQWVIDRKDIRDSKREGSRESGFAQIDPTRYPEDWKVLEDILSSTYRTPIEGVEIRVAELIVDTGGEGDEKTGVTISAYTWWRSLPQNLKLRVSLYKGGSSRTAAPVKVSYVGAGKGGGKLNDIPLLLCNSNSLKGAVFESARREDPGPSKIHLPKWPGAWFWDEWRAEVRLPNGTYKQIRTRNEAIDLCAMNRALVLHMESRRRSRLNWINPPSWALPLDAGNSQVMSPEARREMKAAPPVKRQAPRRQMLIR